MVMHDGIEMTFIATIWDMFILNYYLYGDYISMFIAGATCLGAVYCAIVFFSWWYRLRNSDTPLRPLCFSIFLAKTTLAFWTITTLAQVAFLGIYQPWVTLPARIGFLFVVALQVWVTFRIRPSVSLENDTGERSMITNRRHSADQRSGDGMTPV